MSWLNYSDTLISNLLRVASFVYLRGVPIPALASFIATCYVLYLTTWLLPISSKPDFSTWEEKYLKHTKDRIEDPTALRPLPPFLWVGSISPLSPSSTPTFPALFLALPDPRPRVRLIHLVINTLCILAALDYTFHAHFDQAPLVAFTRVGAVFPYSAKIVVRYPVSPQPSPAFLNADSGASRRDIRVVWRQVSPNKHVSWKDGPAIILEESEDWIGTTKLTGLWPSTTYEYKLTNTNKTHLPYPATPIRFTTFPDPRLIGTHLKFIASSRMTTNYPYVPFHSRKVKGFDLLAEQLTANDEFHNPTENTEAKPPSFLPSFFLFLGGFIHPDSPFHIRDELHEFRRLYKGNYASESFREVYERLPIFHAYGGDEHGHHSVGLDSESGSSAYASYVGNANFDSPHFGENYYDFRYGDVAFFVLDTGQRHADVQGEGITMLGEKQMIALHQWLAKASTTATFKFLISPVPLSMALSGAKGGWNNCPTERAALLTALRDVPNLVVVSGDGGGPTGIVELLMRDRVGSDPQVEVSAGVVSPVRARWTRGWWWRLSWCRLRDEGKEMVERAWALVLTWVRREHARDSEWMSEEQLMGEHKESGESVFGERLVKGLVGGSSTWATFEVDTRDRKRPLLKVGLWVDGKERYTYDIIGVPVKVTHSMALGAFVPGGLKEILDRLGMRPSKWF